MSLKLQEHLSLAHPKVNTQVSFSGKSALLHLHLFKVTLVMDTERKKREKEPGIQTHDLLIIRLALYGCATTADQELQDLSKVEKEGIAGKAAEALFEQQCHSFFMKKERDGAEKFFFCFGIGQKAGKKF